MAGRAAPKATFLTWQKIERRRRGAIPAWGNAPGNGIAKKERAESPNQKFWDVPESDGSSRIRKERNWMSTGVSFKPKLLGFVCNW